MQDKQKELVDNDQVYKQAVEYIKVMSPDNADETSASAVVVRDADSFGNVSGDGALGQGILPQSSTALLEDSINQVGDMLFRNAAANSSGSVIGFSPLYAKEWSHVGMYAGPGNIYDSNNQDCEGTDSDGVAVRLLQEFYDDADTIMYAQLANSSWRSNQAEVLKDAKSNYGTNCSTPFTMNPFSMNGTSSFFCSKLVWRAYLDDDNYPVDLDSNSWTYYWWLLPKYGWATSWYIITHTVAPDEVALSSHVDRYYQKELD